MAFVDKERITAICAAIIAAQGLAEVMEEGDKAAREKLREATVREAVAMAEKIVKSCDH